MDVHEAAGAFGVSAKTIRRAVKGGDVYCERESTPRASGRGATVKTYYDIGGLARVLGRDVADLQVDKNLTFGHLRLDTPVEMAQNVQTYQGSQGRENAKSSKNDDFTSGHLVKDENDEKAIKTPKTTRRANAPYDLVDPEEALERYQQLRPILALPEGGRRDAVEQLAAREGVHVTSIYRRISAIENEGHLAAGRARRKDRGKLRIPNETQRVIVGALLSNPAMTSTRMIHRALCRAVPELMTYERGGKPNKVSSATVQRVRQRLLDDPYSRLLFHDADARKEHIRSYAGEVVSLHANELWQMDMTRCDTMVCDPESGKIFRPRIHALIDVYSGCIPGLAFSIEENQAQTDLAILRSLVPKPHPYNNAWPVYGTPDRLYWDNGKTYTSDHSRRVLSSLGVTLVYSRPRVSHSRGKIERFFGTLHGFEKTLPGYVGSDAKSRSTEELRRITKNTQRWMERGGTHDPGWGDRLLTLHEFEQRALDWILAEYHQMAASNAKESRIDHYLTSVKRHPETQRIYDHDELIITFAHRQKRRVMPNGTIRMNNRVWTLDSGELINHANRDVLVLSNQFAQSAEHILAWEDIGGGINVLGKAVLAPERADSVEARQQRHASDAAAKRANRQAKQLLSDLTDPSLIVSNTLREQAQAELSVEALPQPKHPTARIEAANPTPEPDDELGKFFASMDDYGTDDPKEIMRRSRERLRRIKNSTEGATDDGL